MVLPCPQCLSAIAPGAERCAACGHAPAVPAAGAESTGAMDVCRGCGVIALPSASRCAVCEHEHEAPPLKAPRLIDGRAFWVAVRARFKCRACGHKAPLNHLDMDGSALCVACGVDQAFKARGWERPLKHAHGVGDLSGPPPEGRFPDPELSIAAHNSMASVGVTELWALSGQQGASVDGGAHQSLEIEAAPGHPLCDRCRTPLSIAARTAEQITMRCPAGDAPPTTYPIPAPARGSVAGVITAEERSGQQDIELLADPGGAVAVNCPSCSAPLDLSGACSVVTCRFCSVTSRLPGAVLLKLGFKSVKPLVWWLLFEGPSSRRVEATQLARRDEKQRARTAQRQAAPTNRAAGATRPDPRTWVNLAIVAVVVLTLVGIVLVATGQF